MKSLNYLLKKNPIVAYFTLTFLVSWGAILVLIAINGMPTTVSEAQAQLPLAIMTFCIDYNKSDPLDPEKSDPPIE